VSGELIPIVFFAMSGLVALSFSPLGRALARRIGSGRDDGESQDLRAEVAELRERLLDAERRMHGELDELHNRQDFTERLLAQQKREALPDGR